MSLLNDVKDLPVTRWCSSIIKNERGRHVQALAPRARQFVFDEAASELLGRFITECPDVLVDQMQFALQPYDVTYIELDLSAVYNGTGKPTTASYVEEPDWKIGFLSHAGIINGFTNSRQRPVPYLSPMCVLDNEYHPTAKIDALVDDSRVILGTTWYDLNEAQRAAVAQRFNMGYIGPEEHREQALRIMIPACMGEARVYLAALLFLYQRRHLTLTDHGPRRGLSKGKLRTYMAHTTVTIHLSQYEAVKRELTSGERNSPRRHEVRTHYKHRQLTAGCVHEWVRVDDADNEQWRCTACAGLRWLCRSHLRGDGSIGFVTKHYEVKL